MTLQRRLLRLALPIALANLSVPLAGLVDVALLGHLDEIRHLAGVALASLLFDYVYWTFGFLRMATTGLTAQALGRGDGHDAWLVLVRALLLAVAIAAVILLLRSAIEVVGFALLSGEPQVEASGRAYYRARILGAPAALANFAFVGWFIGRAQGGRALAITVAGNGANVVLDYLLIYRMGLAATGAGLATAASQYLMLAIALAICARQRPAWGSLRGRVFDRSAFSGLLQLNRDILIRTLCLVSAFAGFLNLSALHGSTLLAANALLLKLLDLAAYGIDGLALAGESLAGIFKGRGDRPALRRLLRLGLAWAEAVAVGFVALLAVAGATVYGLLTSHPEVIAEVLRFQGWFALALLFGAAAYIYDGFFIGLTEGTVLRNAMLVSTLVCFAPAACAAWLLGSPHLLWIAFVGFMAARVATLARHQNRVLSAV